MANVVRYISVESPYPPIPVVECACGEEVECVADVNQCPCGALYNAWGQGLRPESEWREDYEWEDD